MPSQAVQTPSPDQLRRYCLEHGVKLESLFKLSWAIILSLYFDTTAFFFSGPVDNSREDVTYSILLHYVPDAAKHRTVVDTLRSISSEYSALYYCKLEEGASQLHKLWSQLDFVSPEARWQNVAKRVVDGRSVRFPTVCLTISIVY